MLQKGKKHLRCDEIQHLTYSEKPALNMQQDPLYVHILYMLHWFTYSKKISLFLPSCFRSILLSIMNYLNKIH